MEASQGTTPARTSSCAECSTANLPGANFCKACGAALAPPPKCPKCEADVDREAKFCSGCGTKLVGPRPDQPKNGQHRSEARDTRDTRDTREARVEPKARKDLLEAEKKNLPPPRKPTSNLTVNVVLVGALVVGIATVIYAMGKGKPKEATMFGGGGEAPAMPQNAAPPPAAGGDDEAIPNGDPIAGEVVIDASVLRPTGGTLFLIVRNQGMPNQGPPLAVRKIADPEFPAQFQIAASDVMMAGVPFVGPFDVYVRLDQDGNAMTKAPGDLINSAPASGIKAGATGVRITLDKSL